MSLFEIIAIAFGLSMDAMAVALSAGACGYTADRRASLRLAWHFGFFQALMPILGWLLGSTVAFWISGFDHWLAFFLLAFVGARMIRSGFKAGDELPSADPTRGGSLILLSVATSIDAFAVGFSFAVLEVSIWFPALAIGLITFALSFLASRLGRRLHSTFGKRMELIGGVVLLLIGLRILLTHLLGS